MRNPKLHNKIARSVATFPVTLLLAVVLWWLPQRSYSHDYLAALLLVGVTGWVIAETNNTFVLLRLRSRMISSFWLFVAACLAFFHPFQPTIFATFCLAVSYFTLFRTYQQHEPVVDAFHAFLMLSVGSFAFPPMLLFAPLYLWHLAVFMRSMTSRVFFASLLGLLLPFWFGLGWLVLSSSDFMFLDDWNALLSRYQFTPIWQSLPLLQSAQGVSFLLLCLLSLWTGVSYVSHYYEDKIQVRMMFYVYITQTLAVVVMAVVWSQHLTALIPLLLLSCSPLIGHYFTLRTSWVSLIVFFLTMLSFIALGVFTLVPESLPYFDAMIRLLPL